MTALQALATQKMRDVLRDAPPSGREEYFSRNFGQIFGWITQPDREFLCGFLPTIGLASVQPLRIVEVGTFGGSTARGLITLTGGGHVTSIDDWYDFRHVAGVEKKNDGLLGGHESGPAFYWSTMKGPPDLTSFATLIEGDSKTVGANWKQPIDLLFIDGDHSYDGALADCRLFSPYVVQGGYVLVDDYQMKPVARACKDYFDHDKWEWLRVPVEGVTGDILPLRRR